MDKKKRFLAIILCVVTLFSLLTPIIARADEETETTNPTESEVWDGMCSLTVTLKSEVTEKTDNIVIAFTPKGAFSSYDKVTLSRKDGFSGTVSLPPDEYKVSFVMADHKYEVELEENYIKVPEARMAKVDLHADKIQDGSFFVKFFRNNSLLLILLAGCGIALYVIKKKKQMV